MRWQPTETRCAQCGFDWTRSRSEAVQVGRDALDRYPAAVRQVGPDAAPGPGQSWAPREYLWHVVDVLRIGTERLWTLESDPGSELPCWDENALAAVRSYPRLSVSAGFTALVSAASVWSAAALGADPDRAGEHGVFGTLSASDVVRRNAHEAVHHLADILAAG